MHRKRMSIFVFSGQHFVSGNYRECIWNIWFLTVSVFCCMLPPTLVPRGQEMQLWHLFPPCYLQLVLQQGVVVRLHNLISSPPFLGLSTGNGTTYLTPWGKKRMPPLSYLLCGFYVCPRADSTVQKISCDFLNCAFASWFHSQFWACLAALLLIFCVSTFCVSTVKGHNILERLK